MMVMMMLMVTMILITKMMMIWVLLGGGVLHWGDWLACIGGYSEAKKDTSHDDVHHDDHCNYDY